MDYFGDAVKFSIRHISFCFNKEALLIRTAVGWVGQNNFGTHRFGWVGSNSWWLGRVG